MAQKKKLGRSKRKAAVRKNPPSAKVTSTGQSLRIAAKAADVRFRRAGQEYVKKGAELEAARRERREMDYALGQFYAARASRAKRPFYNFLAQGDSWFDYTCGFALIHWLRIRFGVENAYIENMAASGRTLRQMLSSDFRQRLISGPGNGQPWSGILLSGGGNDICGDHRFRDWLKPYDNAAQPPEAYIASAFDHELSILQGIYEETIHLIPYRS